MQGCLFPSFFLTKKTGAAKGVLMLHLDIILVASIPLIQSSRILVSSRLRWYGRAGGGSFEPGTRLISKSYPSLLGASLEEQRLESKTSR
jgi:hypothetical protein